MCLTKLDDNLEVKENKGYKIFIRDKKGLYPTLWGAATPYPIGKWVKDKAQGYINIPSSEITKDSYPTGFHIFLNKEDVECDTIHPEEIREVEFDGIVAKGMQSWRGKIYPVVVARRMKILRKRRNN